MLYLLNVETRWPDKRVYYMYETNTESIINGDEGNIRELASRYKIEIKNMHVTKEELKIKYWPNGLRKPGYKGFGYILLAKINEHIFKLVSHRGEVSYTDEWELKILIESNSIVNCSIENGEYKSIDTYKIDVDTGFERSTAQKYEIFRAKSLMLGVDMGFEYNIENKEVRITKYTGTSRRVIIPSFITTIVKEAFMDRNIDELAINEGLKYIGMKAFSNNNIAYVEIPKTTKLIGISAFEGNNGIVYNHGGFRDMVKKLNNKTIILRQNN